MESLSILALLCFGIAFADDTVVHTPLGPVRGLKVTDKTTGENVYEFRGIKYAKPPTGERRFKKPEPVDAWKEEYDATSFGPACRQMMVEFLKDGSEIQSEDCLYLNVYVPRTVKPKEKLSVMVWIHGGGFMMGNGHFYKSAHLAAAGNVIVVTINYRLGIFGFLSLFHSASKGNYGLWDQKLALQWVHDNIASFGGNPGSVTIFGESAGGFSASYQTLHPSNEGLFQRAIPQSGVAGRVMFVRKTQLDAIKKQLSDNTNCSTSDIYKFVDCLKEASADVLLDATNFWANMPSDKVSVVMMYGPVVDGDFFQGHPHLLLEDPNSPTSKFYGSLDFMTGVCSQEGSMIYVSIMPQVQEHFGFNVTQGIPANFLCTGVIKPYVDFNYNGDEKVADAMCKFYTATDGTEDEQSNRAADLYADMIFVPSAAEMLDFHARAGSGKTYQYQVSKISPKPFLPPPAWFKGTGHGDELMFLFYDEFSQYEEGALMHGVQFSDNDRLLQNRVISMWTSFAKTGTPTAGDNTIPWMEYDLSRKLYMDIDDELSLRQNLKASSVKFWNEDLPAPDIENDFSAQHDEL